MHERRLRRMSTDYGMTKEDKKGLNEEINVLERKFKYTSLRMSHGLPQDEHEKMQRELCTWKRQTGETQKRSLSWKVRPGQRMLGTSRKSRS